MTKFLFWASVFLSGFFVYFFLISQSDMEVFFGAGPATQKSQFQVYRGIMNVRSSRSTGSGAPAEIVKEALKSDLDFLILTDPAEGRSLQSDINGYHDKLLVFDEFELPYLDSRILSISKKPQEWPSSSSEVQIRLADLMSRKDPDPDQFLVLAGADLNPWSGEIPPSLLGVEILNPRSMAFESWGRSKLNTLWSILVYPFNKQYALLRLYRDPTALLSWWDQHQPHQKLVGLAGVEASSRALPFPNWWMQFPSYDTSFQLFSQYILMRGELTGNYLKDRAKLFQSLSQGESFFCLDLMGSCRHFRAFVTASASASGAPLGNASAGENFEYFGPGMRVGFRKNLILHVDVGVDIQSFYEVVVLKDGQRVHTENRREFEYPISAPGVYRVYVRVIPTLPFPDGKQWMTWIMTNPWVFLEPGDKG